MPKVEAGVMRAAAEELKKFNDPAREQYEPFLSTALLRATTLLEYMAKHHAKRSFREVAVEAGWPGLVDCDLPLGVRPPIGGTDPAPEPKPKAVYLDDPTLGDRHWLVVPGRLVMNGKAQVWERKIARYDLAQFYPGWVHLLAETLDADPERS